MLVKIMAWSWQDVMDLMVETWQKHRDLKNPLAARIGVANEPLDGLELLDFPRVICRKLDPTTLTVQTQPMTAWIFSDGQQRGRQVGTAVFFSRCQVDASIFLVIECQEYENRELIPKQGEEHLLRTLTRAHKPLRVQVDSTNEWLPPDVLKMQSGTLRHDFRHIFGDGHNALTQYSAEWWFRQAFGDVRRLVERFPDFLVSIHCTNSYIYHPKNSWKRLLPFWEGMALGRLMALYGWGIEPGQNE